jgi:hypothetical protein
MSKTEIDSFLKLYDIATPKLILFDVPELNREEKEKEALQKIARLSGDERANPLDIVLESWISVVSEDISRREITFSSDKVLINWSVRNAAVECIRNFVAGDKERLMTFHDRWLRKFSSFLKQLYERDKKMTVDEAALLAGGHFRISTNSAIRTMISAAK